MSDGGRGRASVAVKVWKSSQKWIAQRSAVRSIAWLDAFECSLAQFNMHTIRICPFQAACVSLRHKNLNQAVVNPSNLHDRRAADASDDLARVSNAAEANLCLKTVEGMTVNAHNPEDFHARRRSMLRLQIPLAA